MVQGLSPMPAAREMNPGVVQSAGLNCFRASELLVSANRWGSRSARFHRRRHFPTTGKCAGFSMLDMYCRWEETISICDHTQCLEDFYLASKSTPQFRGKPTPVLQANTEAPA